MFFIGGIAQKQEAIPFEQIIDCPNCHKYTHLKVFMIYTYFSFFFIPIFKWGKRYFVQSSCCNSICELDKEIGKGIEQGFITSLDVSSLHFTYSQNNLKICTSCGYRTNENFSFCPKCGNKL